MLSIISSTDSKNVEHISRIEAIFVLTVANEESLQQRSHSKEGVLGVLCNLVRSTDTDVHEHSTAHAQPVPHCTENRTTLNCMACVCVRVCVHARVCFQPTDLDVAHSGKSLFM